MRTTHRLQGVHIEQLRPALLQAQLQCQREVAGTQIQALRMDTSAARGADNCCTFPSGMQKARRVTLRSDNVAVQQLPPALIKLASLDPTETGVCTPIHIISIDSAQRSNNKNETLLRRNNSLYSQHAVNSCCTNHLCGASHAALTHRYRLLDFGSPEYERVALPPFSGLVASLYGQPG